MARTAQDAHDELLRKMRARFPIIAVNTWEVEQVVASVKEIALLMQDSDPRKATLVFEWRNNSGVSFNDSPIEAMIEAQRNELQRIGFPVQNSPAAYAAPIIPGRILLETKQNAVVIAHNLHWFMGPNVPQVRQQVIDIADAIEFAKTLILIGSGITIPDELSKLVAIVDWPLPDDQRIAMLINEKAEAEYAAAEASGLDPRVYLDEAGQARLVQTLQGMTSLEIDANLNEVIIKTDRLAADDEIIRALNVHKKAAIRRNKALEYIDTPVTPIGGMTIFKRWFASVKAVIGDQRARDFHAFAPSGILAAGPPGTGKSLLAKTIAHELDLPLIRLDMSAVFGPLVGQSEEQLRDALRVVEAVTPCVLWLDEIEKAIGGDGGSERDGGTQQRVIGYLLTWFQDRMDDPDHKTIFVVATANRAVNLSGALLRRLSEVWFIDLPNQTERVEILNIHLTKNERDAAALGIDLNVVAQTTAGYSGAELQRVVETALRNAFMHYVEDGETDVNQDLLLAAVEEVIPVSRTKRDEIEAMRAWASQARHANEDDNSVSQPSEGVLTASDNKRRVSRTIAR